MDLTVNLRRAWVRTRTHTVVFDRDPEFARFSRDPTGQVQGLLQIWVRREGEDDREYLGSLGLCDGCFRFRELRRLFQRLEHWATRVGEHPGVVRYALANWLRQLRPSVESP